ncbi:hypothetical protein [Blattabacterium cuenoti]|uniref:hypothetical protein n=1 Tax=Blattabacterium cuenoti TaxID=1653831 RepID=UPI001CC226D0|nr:hypothetical protein [Blattabacterium cuenoti]
MNSNGYFVKTEEVFWDKQQKKIFNEKYTMISNLDGIILHAINGIEASDDLKKIKLKNIRGTLPLIYII